MTPFRFASFCFASYVAHALACRVETRLDTSPVAVPPPRRRQEWRRGTHEYVRHNTSGHLISLGRLAAIFCVASGVAVAHDVPDQVSIQAFLRPEGNRLIAAVRIPTQALLDVEFPELPGIGYLDLKRVDAPAQRASRLWVANVLDLYENDAPLPKPAILQYRLARASDGSFASYATALARINDPPIPSSEFVRWDRSVLDVLLETPIRSDRSTFSLQPRWGRLGVRVNTTIVFLPPEGDARTFAYEGDPSRYTLNPTMAGAAAHFLSLGGLQMLTRPDPPLFLFALVVLFRRFRGMAPIFAIFALASSAALMVSAYLPGARPVWMPSLTALLIAAAILYVAAEILIPNTPDFGRRVTVAIAGIMFGAAYWFDLEPVLQFGGSNSTVSISSFAAGLALGGTAMIALMIPAADLYFRIAGPAKINAMILAGLIAHVAWHKLVDRAATLKLWTVAAPPSGIWLLAPIATAALIWLLYRRSRRTGTNSREFA